MYQLYEKIINTCHYASESIKNRYPCKIIKVNISKFAPSEIQYMAASKINIRQSTVKDLLDDPCLVEKFHPTDGIKLGFLAFGEIILDKSSSIEQAKKHFLEIANQLFDDVNNTN